MSTASATKPSFLERLKRTGPGLIIAAATIGPGSVTLACVSGSKYAMGLLWVLLVGVVVRCIYQSMMYRTAIVGDKPLMKVIHDYRPWLGILTGAASFLGGFGFLIGNATGTGMGIQLFFPSLSITLTIIIGCILAIALVWAKDVYKALQNVMTGIVVLMILSFLFSLLLTGFPSLKSVAVGLLPNFPDSNAPFTAIGIFSTTVVFNAVVFGTYLGKQKKWSKQDIQSGAVKFDVALSVGAVALISVLMMATAAVVLNPQGIVVNGGTAMAKALEPVAGPFAKYIFGLGFFGAAISSLIVTSMTGLALFIGGLGKEPNIESPTFRLGSTLIIVAAGVVGLIFGNSPVELVTIGNIASFVSLPVLGIAAIIAANGKELKEFKNNKGQNIAAWICYATIILLAVNSIYSVFK